MRLEEVEIFSDASNSAVTRHPGRRFPGVLVQGDTLHSLLMSVRAALRGDPEELTEVEGRLSVLVEHYETVLAAHGISRPY